MTDDTALFPIGHVAKQLNLRPSTIHFYEREGLLVPAQRTDFGHRLYGQEDLRRLSLLLAMKEIGFSLEEIRAAINLYALDVREVVSSDAENEHAAQIRRKGAALKILRLALAERVPVGPT